MIGLPHLFSSFSCRSGARCWLATAAALLLLPSAGEGQLVVGTDATWIHRSEETVPRGPGMQVWGSFGLSDWVRVTGAVSQEWGRKDVRDSETGRLTFESKGKLESRQVGLELVSPPFLGARLSAGLHLSHHDLSTQSITYWEFDGVRERRDLYDRSGYGWSLGLEGPGMLGDAIRLRAGFNDTRVDLGDLGCRSRVPACPRMSIRRLSVGVATPVF